MSSVEITMNTFKEVQTTAARAAVFTVVTVDAQVSDSPFYLEHQSSTVQKLRVRNTSHVEFSQ